VFGYEDCPRRLKYRSIDHLPEPVGAPLVRGKKIHAEGEAYLKAERAIKIPASFGYVEDELRALRLQGAVAEEQWGFDQDWNEATWRGATIRMILDARAPRGSVMRVVDFKTGKPRATKDEDQLGLYAAGTFGRFPKIRTVVAALWYLDLGQIVEIRFNRKEALAEREAWEARAQIMLDDTKLEPTPSKWTCRFCYFGKSKDGPCGAEVL
jgi:CRISPR/Cas system-associated exonuclease Cas4 (RecB family)